MITKEKNALGPVPLKMVKFNPGLSHIASNVFSSKNMQLKAFSPLRTCNSRLENTDEPLLRDINDNAEWYPKKCIRM